MNKKEKDEGCFSPPFPEDFDERLERLIELAGLSREEFAQRLGIDYDRVAEWFEGAVLTGGEVWHVARLAWSIPGGLEIIIPGAGGGVEGRSSSAVQRRSRARSSMMARAAKRLRRRNYKGPLPTASSAATFRSDSAKGCWGSSLAAWSRSSIAWRYWPSSMRAIPLW